MKPRTILYAGVLGALCAAAAGQVQVNQDCLQTNWFNVCNFNRHECILSSLFCAPYGSLYGMLATAPFESSKKEPWTIYVDTRERTTANALPSGCNDANVVNSSFYDACKASLSPSTGNTLAKYNSTGVVVQRSYLTVQALQSDTRFQIVRDMPTQYGLGALCRCLEFTGDHIHLKDMHCDISNCIQGFQNSYQYNGDDGVMVAFSGGYAGFSTVEDSLFTSIISTDYEFQGLSTGVRFGSDDANGQYVDNVTLRNNNFSNVQFAYAFWDVANQFPDESIHIVTSDSACQNADGVTCSVTFKQAYADAPPLYWNLTESGPQGLYPAAVDLSRWSLVNLSAVVPPSFAYLRREVIRPGFQDEVSHENTAVIVGGVLFLLGAIVLFVVIESCYHRRHDVTTEYDEVRKQK
jgi:hypothetical protein